MLIKNAEVLEVIERVRTVVIDKTGTLTAGTPQVTQCAAAINFSENEMLLMAASVEQKSEHPLGRAWWPRRPVATCGRRQSASFTPMSDRAFRAW